MSLRCPKSKAFLERVMAACERIAPLRLADAAWDNVGLIGESPLPLRKPLVLVTNDLSMAVVEEAVRKEASVIVTYHPPWFKAANSLKCTGPHGAISLCIAHGISIYSPHTALDAIKGGINDWMLKAFSSSSCEGVPIQAVKSVGDEGCGYGRIMTLEAPISIAEAIQMVKSHFKLSSVRVGYKRGYSVKAKDIKTIAVCAGSGGGIFPGVKADLFLTGELGHHQALELCDRANAHVLLTEHSNCERGFLKDIYTPRLQQEINSTADDSVVQVEFSEIDSDPLQVA